MSLPSNPVLQNERSDILDVLRGFALLGILLANIMGLTGFTFYKLFTATGGLNISVSAPLSGYGGS